MYMKKDARKIASFWFFVLQRARRAAGELYGSWISVNSVRKWLSASVRKS